MVWSVEFVAFIGVLIGCLCRTILPYLQKAKANPALKFDWGYAVTFFVSLIESLIATLLLFGALPSEILSGELSTFYVFITSFGWSYTSNDVFNKVVA